MGVVALLLFLAIVLAVLAGYPVAVALGGISMVVGYALLGPAFMQFLPSRLMGVVSNYVLLAVPMFILMGLTLQRSGLAESLMLSAARLAGRRAGGLAIAVLFVGALLAASTGIVGASVVTIGLIALPVMRERGYDDSIAAGIVASAGTLGQIIPPSIVLVLLGSVMQVSVGELFEAALVPGALIVGLYLLYLIVRASVSPAAMPAEVHTTNESPAAPNSANTPPVWLGVAGPVVLIVGVLGSILSGLASPTEASGLGAVVALVLLWVSKRWTIETVLDIGRETARLTGMVYLILFGATTFALVFRGLEGDDLLVAWLRDAGLEATTFVVLLLLAVFVAGFFIDFIEIIFIVVPVVLPVLQAYELDPLWIAILLALNLQTSFLTPPFGFSLFYLRGVAPASMRTASIYRGVVPYIAVQILVLALVFAKPAWFGLVGVG